jgi:peptidoglycan/LPS O-acetylase OafA/YrhL
LFGIYRYGLAFCVAISHLWGGMIGGPAAYAVWGFYCLSGYLMTLILNEKYGFSRRGVLNFAVNRALRIYPAYYVICAGMFLLFFFLPQTSARFLPNLQMPRTGTGWLYSLLLMTRADGNELLHGSLALRVELWFYVAIALGLGRSRRIAWAWFLTSALYTLWLLAIRTPFPQRYVYIPACSLAFSTGCFIYHVRDWIPVIKTPWAALSAACLWWLHVWLTQNIRGGPWVLGLYSSLLFSAFAMATLMRLDHRELPAWMGKLDRFVGNLSYPMYLCHWGVGIMVTWLFPGKTRMDSSVFLIGFPVVNLIAYLIYQHVEHPLQSWKLPSLVRPDGQQRSFPRPVVVPGVLHAAHPLPGPSAASLASCESVPYGEGLHDAGRPSSTL